MRPFETLAPSEARFGLRLALANGLERVRRWYKARLTYKVLCGLDDRALKDIGICRPELRRFVLR
jgi:uncharacterized protein YjiS (DUF1127 family)